MAGRLDGHVSIVTGGESGIGRCIAELFAKEGSAVAITYFKDENAARETIASIENAGGRGYCRQTDVRLEDQVESFCDETIEHFGPLTILVNDAGVNSKGIYIRDMSLERWNEVIATNLTGPFLFCRRFARECKQSNRRGKIINVTSVHEEVAVAGGGEYCASKGGLRNLTRCLALELGDQRINVNNLAPGMVLTHMNQRAIDDESFREERASHVPLDRAATPDEIARLALFLAAPESDYVTGSTFFIDGGLMLQLGQGA